MFSIIDLYKCTCQYVFYLILSFDSSFYELIFALSTAFPSSHAAEMQRLSKTVNEAIVVLKDETQNTLVELRGRGKDIAEAIDQGIKNGKFKPDVKVGAKVYAPVVAGCNVM